MLNLKLCLYHFDILSSCWTRSFYFALGPTHYVASSVYNSVWHKIVIQYVFTEWSNECLAFIGWLIKAGYVDRSGGPVVLISSSAEIKKLESGLGIWLPPVSPSLHTSLGPWLGVGKTCLFWAAVIFLFSWHGKFLASESLRATLFLFPQRNY